MFTKNQLKKIESLRTLYKSYGFNFRFEKVRKYLSPDGTYYDARISVGQVTTDSAGIKYYSWNNVFLYIEGHKIFTFDSMINGANSYINFLISEHKI